MARSRNRQTKKQDKFNPFDPIGEAVKNSNRYFFHYFHNLQLIAYQLFEWKNLPDSIDPSYLERVLISHGHVGFYKDPKLNYIVCRGVPSGYIDNYELPVKYKMVSPSYRGEFKAFNYKDIKEPDMGVIVKNNDMATSIEWSLRIFAEDLAEAKDVQRVNLNAQKTPVLLLANDKNLLTMKNIAKSVDSNVPYIYLQENIDLENIKTFDTKAPYVVDKIQDHRNEIWNEIMTYLGINNANIDKKARVQSAEVESNSEQVRSSGNIFLKARQEACKRINELYGLDVSVDFRENIDLSALEHEFKQGKAGEDNESNDSA